MPKDRTGALAPTERIAQSIIVLRGQRVLLDSDLAVLYEVETRRLNEQVRRNKDRFPADFIFELTDEEFEILMSQFGEG
ncbi:ORF6N domain-containing protein [Steroidobacter flavus]|uniref:ORF6N domain-containing protein n=1 Tax=Steroidobacter flavus TaxID=1842136 RepID=A0ABV8SKY6_9GAMM